MPSNKFNFYYAMFVLASVPLIMILCWSSLIVGPPEPWVTEWTDWLVKYVGLAVAARGLWVVSDGIALWVRRRALNVDE